MRDLITLLDMYEVIRLLATHPNGHCPFPDHPRIDHKYEPWSSGSSIYMCECYNYLEDNLLIDSMFLIIIEVATITKYKALAVILPLGAVDHLDQNVLNHKLLFKDV